MKLIGVARATHAMNCEVCAGDIEYVGKRPHQQSGKYRVNEIDEEKLSRVLKRNIEFLAFDDQPLSIKSYSSSEASMVSNAFLSVGGWSLTAFQIICPSTR